MKCIAREGEDHHAFASAQNRYVFGTAAHMASACSSGSCHGRAFTLCTTYPRLAPSFASAAIRSGGQQWLHQVCSMRFFGVEESRRQIGTPIDCARMSWTAIRTPWIESSCQYSIGVRPIIRFKMASVWAGETSDSPSPARPSSVYRRDEHRIVMGLERALEFVAFNPGFADALRPSECAWAALHIW